MLFRRKKRIEPEEQKALAETFSEIGDVESPTGVFKIAMNRLDDAIKQKKKVIASVRDITKKLADSVPQTTSKART
jgi:hypothetical protein